MSALSAGEFASRVRHGLIPAVPVPFTSSGEIDATAQERYVEYMSRQPVAGVAVWAHTGRGLHLTREQRLQVLESWVKGLGPDKLVVAGVGGSPEHRAEFSSYMESGLQMARDAVDYGAQAFLVHPPRLFHHVADKHVLVLEYHQQLAALDVPLIVFYLYEAAGGILYSPPTLRELFALPQVAGIKLATLDSVVSFQDIAALMAKEFPQKLLITGEDRFLGYSLMCGAQAALIGMGAACCSLQHNLMQAYFEGRGGEFLELSRAVDRLSQVVFIAPMEGYIQRMLWALVQLGVLDRDSAHDPWGPVLPKNEFNGLAETLRALGEVPERSGRL